MTKNELRLEQSRVVEASYRKFLNLVGSYSPGCFNSQAVLEAERGGLQVMDAVLGHVLRMPPSAERKPILQEALERVRNALDPQAVENLCHNLHSAVALYLDLLGCPSVVVRGTVRGEANGYNGFALIACVRPETEKHRPGHSWIVTPYWRVVDLALPFQSGLGEDYESLRSMLPCPILVADCDTSEPSIEWWRLSPRSSETITESLFAKETRYHDVLGWSCLEAGDLKIRYLPGGLCLPEESDLDEISVTIGGLRPGQFFRKHLSDLVAAS